MKGNPMKYQAVITILVECATEDEAAELAQGAAEHLVETFNDDGSLDLGVWHRVQPAAGVAA